MKRKAIRHGDLALVVVPDLPRGLKPAATTVLTAGSNGNAHSFAGGTFYPRERDEFILGYLVADVGCRLLHPEHGEAGEGLRSAPVPQGIYELRRQFEFRHEAMVQVLD